jgi:hypothetical protein
MVLLFYQIPLRKQAFYGSLQKQKPPFGGGTFGDGYGGGASLREAVP